MRERIFTFTVPVALAAFALAPVLALGAGFHLFTDDGAAARTLRGSTRRGPSTPPVVPVAKAALKYRNASMTWQMVNPWTAPYAFPGNIGTDTAYYLYVGCNQKFRKVWITLDPSYSVRNIYQLLTAGDYITGSVVGVAGSGLATTLQMNQATNTVAQNAPYPRYNWYQDGFFDVSGMAAQWAPSTTLFTIGGTVAGDDQLYWVYPYSAYVGSGGVGASTPRFASITVELLDGTLVPVP